MAGLFRFHQVFEKEIEAINERRKLLGRGKVTLKSAGDDREGHPVYGPTGNSNLVGLALSGGGVRSASFCLGVMQALDDAKLMNKVDYLSTVSGGGYIGTSLVAAMSESKNHEFPFPSELEPDEQPALQHVRDHSNYLFPRGKIDLFINLSIYLRGLMANVMLILPFLLIAACITIVSNPTVEHLTRADVLGRRVPVWFEVRHLGITLHVALAIAVLLAAWAVVRVFSSRYSDVKTGWTWLSRIALVFLLFVLFCEIQPMALYGMFAFDRPERDGHDKFQIVVRVARRLRRGRRISRALSRQVAEDGCRRPGLDCTLRPHRGESHDLYRGGRRAARPVGGLSLFVLLGNLQVPIAPFRGHMRRQNGFRISQIFVFGSQATPLCIVFACCRRAVGHRLPLHPPAECKFAAPAVPRPA